MTMKCSKEGLLLPQHELVSTSRNGEIFLCLQNSGYNKPSRVAGVSGRKGLTESSRDLTKTPVIENRRQCRMLHGISLSEPCVE